MTDNPKPPPYLADMTGLEHKARGIIIAGCGCDMDCLEPDRTGCGCLSDAREIIRLARGEG